MLIQDKNTDIGICNKLLLGGQVGAGYFVKLVLRFGDEVFDLIGGAGEAILRGFGDSHDEEYPQQYCQQIDPVFV